MHSTSSSSLAEFQNCTQLWTEHFKEKQRNFCHQSIIALLIHVLLLLFNSEKLLDCED